MKFKFRTLGIALCAFVACVGCSTHSGYMGHVTSTQVQLGSNNFVVVGSVSGQAEANYFLKVFGPSDQNPVDQARRDMFNKAELKGKSRAIVNITTDEKYCDYILGYKRTIYLAGDVVEFVK